MKSCKPIGEAVAVATLGEVIKVAIHGCLHPIKRTWNFNSYLDGLQSSLSKLNVIVKSREELGQLPREEINGLDKLMKKGEKLVEKCSRLKRWKLIDRCYYAYELHKLDKELLAFFQTYIVACNTRDLSKVLQLMKEIEERVITNRIITDRESSGDDKKSNGGGSSHGDADEGLHE